MSGRLLFLLASAVLLACSGGGSPAQPVGPGNTTLDAQADATVDASALDAGADAEDAPGPSDASVPDASVPDVSAPDVQGDP